MLEKNVYTTRKGQQGEDVLFINGMQSICPFTPALMIGGNLGQTQIIRLPCSTVCPHAVLHNKRSEYEMWCTGTKSFVKIEPIEQSKDDNNDNVKKMIIT